MSAPDETHASAAREPTAAGRARGDRPVDQLRQRAVSSAPLHQKQHDNRLWTLQAASRSEMWAIPEWEELRNLAGHHEHTLSHLDEYLEQFERNARANGVSVHWSARR